MTNAALSEQEYDHFRKFLEGASGIVLGEGKHYLVTSRLNRLVDELSFGSLGELIKRLTQGVDVRLKERVVDAMTTNETMWFRDTYPFDILKRHLLPELGNSKKTPLRIWSAASSSGQETYSISMSVSEFNQTNPGKLQRSIEIVGTDISPSMLAIAKAGVYEEMVVTRGLSEDRRRRFFRQREQVWELAAEVRNRTRFTELNLLGSYALMGKFDLIFCRNVLIYFSSEIKSDILNRMAQTLAPGGYLFLGGSESPTGYSDAFEMVRLKEGVVYRRKEHWKP